MRIRINTLLCAIAVWVIATSAASAAEQGQYRSKILLTPDGEWAKGTELSIEELERQLGSIEEAYAKSSAGRHLARHYVERGEYDKAIGFYREALAAEGLSAIANREMLRELAQVYLLKKDYAAAAQTLQRSLAIDLVPDFADYLLLARAQHHLGQYVDSVATLDRLQQADTSLDAAQMQQALALYYRAGAFAQCEVLLGRLLELQPDEPQHWHLLASVYLQQNKKKQALDQLTLAREKLVPFAERDILLLANLHAANNNPYGAAEVLKVALSQQEVPASGANYRKLFEFWLQARERDKARQALEQAARLSGDTELYLYLAQLQMEQEDFENMYQTMLAACAEQLSDQYVGRANLLLGVSQLKLGDAAGARRAFINATLVGGVNAEAGQWLRFMNAAPATDAEARRIIGVCYGSRDRRQDTAASMVDASSANPPDAQASAFAIRTVPAMRLFYVQYDKPLAELAGSLRATVVSMYVSLVKSGGSADGPLHIIFSGDRPGQEAGRSLQLGLPTRGSASGGGKFRVRTTDPFKCAYQPFEGPAEALATGLARLAESVQAASHELTGEGRIVIPQSDNADDFRFELQLGIR